MVESLPEDVTPEALRAVTLPHLLEAADEADEAAVTDFLETALVAAADFLADHGKRLDGLPTVEFAPYESGVSYDPYADGGEVLVVGGPRGLHRGGEAVLYGSGSKDTRKNSLLTVLGKGLLHSYNQCLVEEHFDRPAGATESAEVDIYAPFEMLAPAVDEGITQLFVLYVDGDVTDRGLREAYIDAWAEWFDERTTVETRLFRAVAYTIADRIEAAEGSDQERFVEGLQMQEPLVRDGNTSVLEAQLRVLR